MNSTAERCISRLGTTVARRRLVLGREWSQGAWVVCDQAVVSLASFLTTVIVGRVCGQREMGVYALAVSIFWLAAGIPNALVWTPYTARAARLRPGRRAIYAGSVTAHALLIATSLAALTLLIGILPLPMTHANAWVAPMCLALVPFIVLMTLREHVRRISIADLRTRDLLAIDVPIAVLQLALLLWLARAGRLTAATALLAVAIACSLAALWLLHRRERIEFRQRHVAVHWSYNQRFGRWLLLVTLAWLVGDASYRWMVGSIQGIEALGRFAAAQSIVLVINPLLITANNLAQAWSAKALAEGGIAAVGVLATRATRAIAIGAGLAFAALAVAGGLVIRVIFGPEYGGLGGVVAALALGMFAHSLLVPIDAATIALRRGRMLLAAAAVRLALAIGFGAPLIWWRGAEGVGYAMAVSSAAAAGILWTNFLSHARESSPGSAPP